MNQEIIYQNQETVADNPLQPPTPPRTPPRLRLPKDPRLLALVILFGLIVLLIPLSLISSSLRQDRISPTTPFSTPVPPSPTPPITSAIPSDIVQEFQKVDDLLNLKFTLDPPTTDESIGL